jgi:4-hydroxy 2-oxovalerate aldolase
VALLLDTTIRDGSNAIDHGFTEEDIRTVVTTLAVSGITHIEVGHGVSVGLGAAHGASPKVPDAKALAIAREAAPAAKIGAIAVPVLASAAAIEPLYDHLDFLRLAMASHELDTCRRFAEVVLRSGKQVFIQLVKSDRYPLDQLVGHVQTLVDDGVHALYIVDTVGGMAPQEVARYVAALRDAFAIQIGFHGHNNCSSALANALAAMDAGADLIDATVGGIGRGAGNLQLELFVAQLQRRGQFGHVALEELFQLSSYLWQRFPNVARGIDPLEVCYATHGLDSLSRNEVLRTARARRISEFALIRELPAHASGFLVTPDDVRAAADAFEAATRPNAA